MPARGRCRDVGRATAGRSRDHHRSRCRSAPTRCRRDRRRSRASLPRAVVPHPRLRRRDHAGAGAGRRLSAGTVDQGARQMFSPVGRHEVLPRALRRPTRARPTSRTLRVAGRVRARRGRRGRRGLGARRSGCCSSINVFIGLVQPAAAAARSTAVTSRSRLYEKIWSRVRPPQGAGRRGQADAAHGAWCSCSWCSSSLVDVPRHRPPDRAIRSERSAGFGPRVKVCGTVPAVG